MTTRYAYIANPYSSLDTATEEERYQAAVRVTAILVATGMRVYAAIPHTHPIHVELVKQGIMLTKAEWMAIDKPFLTDDRCVCLVVLCFPGWQQSVGLQGEIEFCLVMKKPVLYLNMDEFRMLPGGE